MTYLANMGMVRLKGQDLACQLKLDNPSRAHITIKTGASDFSLNDQLDNQLDFLSGVLDNGLTFTALDNKFVKSNFSIVDFTTTHQYEAGFVIIGKREKSLEDLKFTRLVLRVPDLIKFTTMSAYQASKLSEITNKPKTTEVLYAGKDFRVDLEVKGVFVPSLEDKLENDQLAIPQETILTIESHEPRPFAYLYEKFQRLMKLVEMSTAIAFRPDQVLAYDGTQSYQVLVRSDEELAKTIDPRDQDRWIVLPEFIYNGDLGQYFAKYDKLVKVLDPYIEARKLWEKQDLAFQMAALAVDRFYGAFRGDKDTFEERLKDLTFIEEGLAFNTLVSPEDFPGLMAKTRSYYETYTGDCPVREEDLTAYIKVILGILDYYILEELGFKSQHAKQNILIKRWGTVTEDD